MQPDLAAMNPPQAAPTAGGAPPSPAVVDVPVGGPPNAGDVSAMISATIPLKRKRIPKQFFEAPAAAAAPSAVTAGAAKKGSRMNTKAVGPRGAPPSKVKTKAVSRIGLVPPPPSKATAPPPSVPSAATPAPPPPSMDVDKVFDVESTTSYMDMLNDSSVDLDAGIDVFDGEDNVEGIDDYAEEEDGWGWMRAPEDMDEDQLAWWKETKADIMARKMLAHQARAASVVGASTPRATAAPPRSAARTRRSRPRSAVSKVAILRELVGKAAAVRACAIARGSATKSCAIARTAAAKACAQERVSSAGVAARLAMQLARNKFDIWMLRRAQECELKRVDYELKLEEYEEWRMIQFEIKLRDIFKRMQKLGHIDPAREFPIPLRPDLYNYRPSPLPPSKPMMQTYAEYLQHVGEVVGLFNKTVKILFVSPAVSVGTVVCSAALGLELYEEFQRPGTFKNHLHQLSTIFKGFLLEGFKEDPSKVKQEEAEGDKAQEEASDAKQEVDKAKEEASDGKQEGDKAKEEASDGNLEGDKAKEEASDGKQEDVKASDAKQEGDKAKEEASDGKQEGDKAKEEASPK
ncbi:hypothetical protein ACQ4PT_023604 [Festuca glaucescens]